MKILIVTDAWSPQINGVVTTLQNTKAVLESRGHIVSIVEPSMFYGVPCPGYREIKLALPSKRRLTKYLEEFNPDKIHIATEGPLGIAMRKVLKKRGENWSSSFHTKFAEYIDARIGRGGKLIWTWLRKVYQDDKFILVTTLSMQQELIDQGFNADRLIVWGRGVDDSIFAANIKPNNDEYIFLNVGRVSVEKNLEEFYKLNLPGRKVQVGDGPALNAFREKYPEVDFVGSKHGLELAAYYRIADVMVFPSRSDTFGLVMIESMRCGTPVAAYPVTGPIDIIQDGLNGFMNSDLAVAIDQCLAIPRQSVIEHSAQFTWNIATDRFEEALVWRK